MLSEKVFPELVSSLLSSFNDWSDEDFAAFLASTTGDKAWAFIPPDSKELLEARGALTEMLNETKKQFV